VFGACCSVENEGMNDAVVTALTQIRIDAINENIAFGFETYFNK